MFKYDQIPLPAWESTPVHWLLNSSILDHAKCSGEARKRKREARRSRKNALMCCSLKVTTNSEATFAKHCHSFQLHSALSGLLSGSHITDVLPFWLFAWGIHLNVWPWSETIQCLPSSPKLDYISTFSHILPAPPRSQSISTLKFNPSTSCLRQGFTPSIIPSFTRIFSSCLQSSLSVISISLVTIGMQWFPLI